MQVVGSSKMISKQELFFLLFLLQQGGMFWVLPYLLTKEQGLMGAFVLLIALFFGIFIITLCMRWGTENVEYSLPQFFSASFGKTLGNFFNVILVVQYFIFTVIQIILSVELLDGQLLVETPRIILLVSIFFVVIWLSWNGLEDMARFSVFCPFFILLWYMILWLGNYNAFSWEQVFPLQLQWNGKEDFFMVLMQGLFAYSECMAIFFMYPAISEKHSINKVWLCALFFSGMLFVLELILAIGVFGKNNISSILWVPLELARMVQLGPFIERIEAIFIAAWVIVFFLKSSLFFWCVSESTHQLFRKEKSFLLHIGIATVVFGSCVWIKNMFQLLQIEKFVVPAALGMTVICTTAVWIGIMRRQRKGA